MARVAAFTYPDPSHVLSSLPVFAELARRGEEVILYSSQNYREAIEKSGASFRCYSATMGASSTGPFGGMRRRIEFAEQVLPELVEDLRSLAPEYVILDAAAHWGSIAADLLKIATISYRLTFALHRTMIDGQTMVQRFYGHADCNFLMQGMIDLVSYYEAAQRIDSRYGSNACSLAASLECRCGLNLVLIARALQIESARFDESYRFTGRCLGNAEEPDEFNWNLLDGKPLVYISLGTVFNNRPEFFRSCIDAFGAQPVQVVMSVGRRVDLATLGATPANFIVAPYFPVPIVKLLSRCALVINHAGANTLEESARAGVPQLMYPQAGDQFVLADLVQQLGAGLRLTDADIEAGRLRALAFQIIGDPGFRKAAARLQQSVQQTGGTAQACDEILAYTAALTA